MKIITDYIRKILHEHNNCYLLYSLSNISFYMFYFIIVLLLYVEIKSSIVLLNIFLIINNLSNELSKTKLLIY